MGIEVTSFGGNQEAESSQEDNQEVSEEQNEETGGESEEQEETLDEAATSENEDSEEDSEEQGSEEEKGEYSKRVTKRINRALKQRNEARREAREKDAKIAALEARILEKSGTQEQPKAEKVDGDPEPKLDDFEDYSDYVKASSRWAARQEHKSLSEKSKEADQKNQEKSAYEKSLRDHSERLQEFAKSTPDTQEVLEDFVEASLDVPKKAAAEIEAVVLESEKGPEIVYYLGKNPQEIERIAQLSPRGIAKELGRIEASLSKPESKETKVSKAPAPIRKTVGSRSGAKVVKSVYDVDSSTSQKEFERLERERMKGA